MRQLVWGACSLLLMLVIGCNTQVIRGEAAERLRHPVPYGARWVKEGMTRESRLDDWMVCGGGRDLRDGFRERHLSESYSSYYPLHESHRYDLWVCMRSKGYEYFNKGFEYEYPKLNGKSERCDTRCLYP